jgi:hypothetical protein
MQTAYLKGNPYFTKLVFVRFTFKHKTKRTNQYPQQYQRLFEV